MKYLVALTLLAAVAFAKQLPAQTTTAYGYLKNIGIPEAQRIRKAEDEYLNSPSRIVGGMPALPGQLPWQAGLLIDLVGLDGIAVCGASLVSADRLITAAHCWSDGQNQAWRFTVVLGSNLLFSGGTRVETSVVFTHPSWISLLLLNDVAVIYLPSPVTLSANIAPIALPFGDELEETFAGTTALSSGFGINENGNINANQFLSLVNLNVITNDLCSLVYPIFLQDSNICTSGLGGVGLNTVGLCGGDSGGPLVHTTADNRQILIGVSSFGSVYGCDLGLPAVFARTATYIDFFNQHI